MCYRLCHSEHYTEMLGVRLRPKSCRSLECSMLLQYVFEWRSLTWTGGVRMHGEDDWGKGSRSGGLQATGRRIRKKVISSPSCSRKNSRAVKINEGGNGRKQIKVSDTDRMDATSYEERTQKEMERNVRLEIAEQLVSEARTQLEDVLWQLKGSSVWLHTHGPDF